MSPGLGFKYVKVPTRLVLGVSLVILFGLIYAAAIHIGLARLIARILRSPGVTNLAQIINGLIVAGIIFASSRLSRIRRFANRGPLSLRVLTLKSFRRRFSRAEIEKQFDLANCKMLRNGCLARGNHSSSESVMTYKNLHDRITVAASFKARVTPQRHHYWRYGIAVTNKEKELALFHLDSSDYIVLYLNKEIVLQYRSEDSFGNRSLRLKACVSRERTARIISFFLDGSLMYQMRDEGIEDLCSAALRVWSDNEKDHNVRIRDIFISR
jgi:hypothetical protein